jgi:hypothetical protein
MCRHALQNLTEIRSTDANFARDCLKSDTCDHHEHIENFAISLSDILDAQPSLQINLGWLPAAKGSLPLRRLKAIVAETAHQSPTLPPAHRRHQQKPSYVLHHDKMQLLNGRTGGWRPRVSSPPTWRSQTHQTVAFPPSSRELPNSRGPLWPLASDSLQATHSPVSTLPIFAPVLLIHTIASAENPYKWHTTSSRHARYTPKHGDDFSCQSQTHFQSQPSSVRRKEVRP